MISQRRPLSDVLQELVASPSDSMLDVPPVLLETLALELLDEVVALTVPDFDVIVAVPA